MVLIGALYSLFYGRIVVVVVEINKVEVIRLCCPVLSRFGASLLR